ncbi:NFACT family protein [Candidatus Woesearchaeota archaeon]|nr:NFACT family protein [Candidatus Woesearchaeota archaeon]
MPKKEMRSLELRAVVQELQPLCGLRLDKVYQPYGQELYLQFRKQLVRILLPKALYLTAEKPEMTKMPGTFCTTLRNELQGMFLDAVEQLGFDRIVTFRFAAGEKKRSLVVELLHPGNAVMLDEGGVVLQACSYKSWKDRQIRRGSAYTPPPARKNPLGMDAGSLSAALSNELVKILAAEFQLGNAYAEEVCIRAKVDKHAKTLDSHACAAVLKEVQRIVSEKPDPHVVYEGEGLADAVLWPLEFYSGMRLVRVATASAAMEAAFKDTLPEAALTKVSSKHEQLQRVLGQQDQMIASLGESIVENQRKGEMLYEQYQEVAALLAELGAASRAVGWAALKGKPRVLDMNPKEKSVTVELTPSGS